MYLVLQANEMNKSFFWKCHRSIQHLKHRVTLSLTVGCICEQTVVTAQYRGLDDSGYWPQTNLVVKNWISARTTT